MKAQAVTVITSNQCAREVMETVPLVMRFIHTEMRSRRAPLLSVPQFRVLTFLSGRPGAPLSSVAEHLGVALFKPRGHEPLTAGNDLNHLALNVASGTYETLKAELENHGVTVTGRPGEDRCIYFNDPDGHRLQLMVRS
jgi:hypothetical protein